MNIVSKLTLKHLLCNKKRSAVTIFGIATSTALISAILLGVFSFFKFFGEITVGSDGKAQGAFMELSNEQILSIKNDDKISIVGITDTDPTISGIRVDSDKEERFRVGNIAYGDENYYSLMVFTDYEGELPANSNEIAVEEKFLEDNGLELKIGDTLTFEQGNRYSYDENGELIYWAGNYRSEEKFRTLSEKNCTITAVLHENRPTKGYDVLCGMNEEYVPAKKYCEGRFCLKNCDHTAIRQIKEIAKTYGIDKYQYNTEYMLSVFALEDSAGTYRSFFFLMGIALLIVIITSVVLIVNSLGMSLTEKLRYLGMLASVGATGRQKRFSIYFEGFILGIIGIPLGLLFGYIGTKITMTVLGSRILAADIIVGAEGMRGSIPISCSPWVILIIVIFSGITIYVSTLIPALKAAKAMPIDAIRENQTIKLKAKKLKINPLIRKFCGYEGELAYKNIKRNGIKGTVITVSIAVSVIMLLTINYFCDSIERANQFDFNLPYQLAVSCSLTEGDKLKETISRMDGVDKVFNVGMIEFPFEKRQNQNISLANTEIVNPEFLTPDYQNFHIGSIALVIIDDSDFEKILEANGLSKEKYLSDTLRGVLCNNIFHENRAGEVFTSGILGQSLHYDEKEGNPPAVEIGDFVDYDAKNDTFEMTPKGTVTVYVPASVYYENAKKNIPEDILTVDLGVVTKKHEEICRNIYEMLEKDGYHNYSCSDMANSVMVMNTVTMMLKTVMYGFTILLSLIAIANIVNTISTGILLRRKEFAMYKSVGLASGGFQKMLRLETAFYGIRALMIGIPFSLLLSFLMFHSFSEKIYSFTPNWLIYLAVTAGVFGVVGLSMFLSIHKIKDDNIIEALKEDMA